MKNTMIYMDRMVNLKPSEHLTLNDVKEYYALPIETILGTGRIQDTIRARQAFIYLLWKKHGLAYAEIGRRMKIHHTTAMYTIKKIDRDENFKKEIEDIINNNLY